MSRSDIQRREAANARAFTDSELVAAWCRWAPELAIFLAPCSAAMLDAAELRAGDRVLDLASGTGDPALAVARAVAPDGEVIATDIAADILSCARRRADDTGITNIRFQQADAGSLGFARDSFDRVLCRFGIMYVPDPASALRRVRELMRQSGRVVLMSWGSREQPYFACTRGIVERRIAAPAAPDAPDTFSFSRRGSLAQVLREAGFDEIDERTLRLELHWPGSPARLWQFMQELTASYQALARQAQAIWADVTAEVLDALQPYVRGTSMVIPAEVNLAVATTPDE